MCVRAHEHPLAKHVQYCNNRLEKSPHLTAGSGFPPVFSTTSWHRIYIVPLFAVCHYLRDEDSKYLLPPPTKTNLSPFVPSPSCCSGLGITGGVHRLWAHRSYDAHWSVRVFMMLINSVANQGSIYHWARDHRGHHKCVPSNLISQYIMCLIYYRFAGR